VSALARLVAAARGRSAEFDPFMANHLPMALVILDRLGADDRRLESFAAAYEAANPLKEAPEDRGRIDAGNWSRHLGDRDLEGDFRGFFAREVARLGPDGAQRAHLPVLVPGVAASALHALMRLAYADLAGDAEEVGVALGYWACTHLPLRAADGAAAPATDRPAALLAELRKAPHLCALKPPSDLLWHWMRAVAAEPDFPDAAALLAPAPDLLARVAHDSLALMAGTMTFEALHAVTSAHWLRLVGPRWPDEALAVRHVWQAVASVYPKIGMPELPTAERLAEERRRPCPAWPDIAARAVASDDEHDISLAFSAREEHAFYGDRLYQVVAARRLGLIG
jgi:hypothetical protein